MRFDQFRLHSEIEEKHWWFLGRRRIVRSLVHCAIPPSKSALVVDVGCGTGANIAAFSQDFSCVGIDTSKDAIKFAKSCFPDIQFIHGSIFTGLPEIKNQADLFLLMDVLEHTPDDSAFLTDLLVVLKPGAHLLITVPADMSLWSPHDVSFGHYRRYDWQRLERLWYGLPVTVLLFSYYNSRLYPIIKVMRTLSRWRGHAWGPAGVDNFMPIQPINRVLENIFAGEAKVLLQLLCGKRVQGFTYGASLIALLRRETGSIVPSTKPQEIPPDPYEHENHHEN